MKVSIGEAAEQLGVAIGTLRRWEREGKITAERTPGGHRRYDLTQLLGLVPRKTPVNRATLCYARVSTHEQKDDLGRQIALLEAFCSANGWTFEVIQDIGSGLNYRKRGLKLLLQRLCSGEIDRLVLSHKDRLLRFGAELVFTLCELFSVEVVIINATEALSFEEELAGDVLEIITVFSARLYGSRSQKNRKVMAALREAAEEL